MRTKWTKYEAIFQGEKICALIMRYFFEDRKRTPRMAMFVADKFNEAKEKMRIYHPELDEMGILNEILLLGPEKLFDKLSAKEVEQLAMETNLTDIGRLLIGKRFT